jgi:hypothetical protein
LYVHAKLRPVETIPGMRERRKVEGVNSSMVYLTYYKDFVNVTMYPQHNNNNKRDNQ